MQCISPVYIRSQEMHVPCGKCNFCLRNKRSDWSFRLLQEQKVSSSSHFITLTYDDNHLVYDVASRLPVLVKRDVQLFTKRLRKVQSRLDSSVRLRYYLVGEYGSIGERPHYHIIMFNMDQSLVPVLFDIWRGGLVHVGSCTAYSIGYVTKYVINRVGDYAGREPPFALMSRKPGIGANYLQSHKKWHESEYKNYTQVDGVLARLPRYYKERLFEPWERAHMARVALARMEESYRLELQRLSKLHPDPANYYDERIRSEHELATRRINEKDKF